VEITAEGPNNSLSFWWSLYGFTTWHTEQVAGPGTTFAATFGFFGAGPVITDSGGGVQIAAQGPMGSLWLYEAPYGSMIWHAVQVAGNGAVAGSPAMVLSPTAIEITAIDTALGFWSAPRGSYTFSFEQIPGQPLTPNPAMVRFATGTEIAAASAGCTPAFQVRSASKDCPRLTFFAWSPTTPATKSPKPGLRPPKTPLSRQNRHFLRCGDGGLTAKLNSDRS